MTASAPSRRSWSATASWRRTSTPSRRWFTPARCWKDWSAMPTTYDEHEQADGNVPRTPEGGRGVLHTPTDAEARPAGPNTLPALLLADEREAEGALALATESATLTYAELGRAARALAAGLIASGIAPGDRVGIWLPNGPDWLAAHWAAALCGAIVVPLNTRYRA